MKLIVIGAGPGGIMAAITARLAGVEVVVLEKMKQIGKKMLITGKGRCNITNITGVEEMLKNIPANSKFLYSALTSFDSTALREFFESEGLALKVERGGRVFPVSDKALDVVETLLTKMLQLGIEIRYQARVKELLADGERIAGVVLEGGEKITADCVLVATGGMSYPGTGSSGDGYQLAEKLGHKIVPIKPALVPLNTAEDWVQAVQGLALKNIEARLIVDGKKGKAFFGEMLFTHFGVSGPVILTLSREAVEGVKQHKHLELAIDLKPALTKEQLDKRILRDFAEFKTKQIKNVLPKLLPVKLIPIILDNAIIADDKPISEITKAERLRLVGAIKELILTIKGPRPMTEAIVTAGGISTKEINPKTMESKLVKGLYFAGEVVDVDAYTGGFNLQIAFSMGHSVGVAVGKLQASDN